MKKFIFAGLLALFVMSCNGNTGAAVSDSTAVDSALTSNSPVGDSISADGSTSSSADSVAVDSTANLVK